MNALDNSILNALLSNDGSCLFANESVTLEYKSDFDWSNKEKRAKYCKSIAAFCNNEGGYIVFGIDDKTKKILGVENFNDVDSASISDHLNNYFSPSINFNKRSIEVAGKEVGVFFIEKHKSIPAICIKSFDTILKDGALFYRYSGKSDYISGTDLVHLLHQTKGSESKELVDLKRTEMKQQAKPNFIFSGGGSSSNTLDFRLKNVGKRAKIISVKSNTDNINVFGVKTDSWIEEEGILQIHAANTGGIPGSFSIYEIEIRFDDSLGTKYSLTFSGKGATMKLEDPKEI